MLYMVERKQEMQADLTVKYNGATVCGDKTP